MDIGTGKDIKKYGRILGYDLVRPDEEFSVSQYVNFVKGAIEEIYSKNKLPILVGGTGLYIKAVVDNLNRISIPRNIKLRKKLAIKTSDELFAILMKINPMEALKLNPSDKANPRRLVRLLEVLSYGEAPVSATESLQFDEVLWVGLRASERELKELIAKRVDERIKSGFEKEVGFLKQKDFFRYAPSVTLGYKDWPDAEKWKHEEFKYAKRQMTWFKKDRRIRWFDPATTRLRGASVYKEVEDYVRRWHNIQNAKEN